MRLTFLALLGCLACDPGAATVVTAPQPSAPETQKAAAPPSASSLPAAGSANLPPASPHLAASADASAGELGSDGEPHCRFQRPRAWAGGVATWLGSCQK